jgi:DNA-binding CsgD family transcriptional regulator/tetratricopeptide (TPR) repeat protein
LIVLVGRAQECAEIDRLLAAVRDGLSGTLVVRGDAGVGKTFLLETALDAASDLLPARVVGVESEIDLGFAALHQLLMPFLGLLERLPPPQSDALGVAFGLRSGPAPERFLVGLATLSLLALVARGQPLLCVIDDAQWLDVESAHVLAFVSRRLYADAVGLLLAVRDPEPPGCAFDQLPTIWLSGLPDVDARRLLASVAPTALTAPVVERILADTAGNPLGIVELGSEHTAQELAAGASVPEPLPLSRRLEARFVRQVRTLAPDTQMLLLLAAAEPSAQRVKLWRAAAQLGLDAEASAVEAESSGLVNLGATVSFRHPLVRSAIYHGAIDRERRRAHAALAEVSDGVSDEDGRAWHLAAAAVAPDEAVAAELERAADRARGRGGYAGRAALLRRVVELTPEETRRATRALALAEAELIAGNLSAARQVVDQALPRLDDDRLRGLAMRLHGAILVARGMVTEAADVLSSAAQMLAPHESEARETLLAAFEAAVYAGPTETRRVVDLAHSFLPAVREPSVADLLLEGFAARYTAGYEYSVAPFRDAIRALSSDELDPGTGLRWFSLGCVAAGSIWDDQGYLELSTRWVRTARTLGALATLPIALGFRTGHDLVAGRLDDANARLNEAREITAATGNPDSVGASWNDHTSLWLRGRSDEARAAALGLIEEATARGQLGMARFGQYTLARVEISDGRFDAAVAVAMAATEDDAAFATELILPELVEAAMRAGRRDLALAACETLSARAQAAGTHWGLGLAACARGLVSDDADAEEAYRDAVDHLGRTSAVVDLARSHLLFGEWLRRAKRRTDARHHLGIAHDLFLGMGADGYTERAGAELVATGGRARRRTPATSLDLTPQEARVAELATDGASNSEIAAQLFLSASTVEYHLKKVFRKLNVTSRTQLARRMLELKT